MPVESKRLVSSAESMYDFAQVDDETVFSSFERAVTEGSASVTGRRCSSVGCACVNGGERVIRGEGEWDGGGMTQGDGGRDGGASDKGLETCLIDYTTWLLNIILKQRGVG